MTPREGFPPGRRLRKRREYLALRSEGRRVGGQYFVLTARRRARAVAHSDLGLGSGASNGSSLAVRTRFGITVTRKVGNAVARNRIKRWVREACRRVGDLFPPGVDVVIVARPSAVSAGAAETRAELTELARRLGRSGGGSAGASAPSPRRAV